MADSGPSGFSSSFDASRSESSLRQTAARRVMQSPASVFGSPTSTIGSTSTPTTTRMPLRTNPVSTTFTPPSKRVIIRADPTLVSYFDPADKELYDLWAPKQ